MERRQAIEAQVSYRVAAAEEAERQRRATEAARRAQAYTRRVLLPPPPMPLRRNVLGDYLDPQPTLPTDYLSEFLRRR